jgi:hypothetical protein
MNAKLRVASVALISAAVLLVATLHVVSDLNPVEHRMSEYAIGAGGWAMTLAFVLTGSGLLMAGALFIRTGATIAGVAMALAGIAMLVSGVFPTEPGANTTTESLHSTFSAMATFLIVAASLVWSFMSPRSTQVTRVLALTGPVLLVASFLLHDTAVSGVSQRILWMVLIGWTIVATLASPSDSVTAES